MTFCLIKLGKYDEALKYLALAEDLAQKNGEPYFIAKCNDARGQVLMGEKKFAEAIPYFSKAALIFKDQNNQWSESYQYGYIAGCNFELGNLDECIRYGNMGLNIGKQNKYIPVILMASKVLSEGYARLGNNQKSYEYLKVYSDTKDHLLQNDIDNRLTDLETQSLVQEAQREKEKLEEETYIKEKENVQQRYWLIGIACCLMIVLFAAWFLHKSNRDKKVANKLLNEQKTQIEEAMIHLKATQSQLIQSEKMASLGELTAGIAHEIQNPLNFVNNFSEVSVELIGELKSEKAKPKSERDDKLEEELLNDITQNLEKINHHGKRADGIVKGMLQHSRSSSGQKEPTDINALADEYLRLAYHGIRAKDKSFNATLKTDFDQSIGTINIIPQDIGRVILNLITNAFYVVDEKKKQGMPGYEPTVSVSTKKVADKVLISVTDNGNGIPDTIKDKIFQPFFTTKPTGQGTGLGLSLSYDIVKAHGGELKVETKEGEGTVFILELPVVG
jgi:signal transduction histidine kinase